MPTPDAPIPNPSAAGLIDDDQHPECSGCGGDGWGECDDPIGNRWVGPVGDGTIVVEIFGDELESLVAAVRQAAGFPVAHVELFTDAAGDHRWRAIARNGRVIAGSGEGYRNAAHAQAMAERMLPGVEIRDEEADRG